MLTDISVLSSLFPMRGYALLHAESSVEPGEDVRRCSIQLVRLKDREEASLAFTLPEPDGDGILSIGETHKVVVSHAKRGANYELGPNSLKNVWVSSPQDVVKWMLRDAFDSALAGPEPGPEILQSRIDSFFATSRLTRTVTPYKPIDAEMAKDVVLIEAANNPVDYKQRMYEDWEGCIDLVTTPAGKFVGQLFRMVEGARVDKGRLVPSEHLFSRPMKKYLLFPENNRPDRLAMTRSVLAQHEEVVVPEQPLVAHHFYDGRLRGVHLLTGVVSWPLNYYDCIVVSESAAAKLACRKITRQVVIDSIPGELLVKEGQFVKPDGQLLRIGDRIIYASKIKFRSVLIDLRSVGTMVGRVPSTKHIFTFSCVYPAVEGSKICGRFGNKGVVKILSDHQMPYVEQDGERVILECLVHPRSFVGRRNLGALREMMANKKVLATGEVFRTRHFSAEWSMRQLVEEGYGGKQTVFLDGVDIGEAFHGPLYWFRTDKHAIDVCSAVGEVKPVDQRGLNPDRGSSGQRLGPDVAAVMEAKGMGKTLERMMGDAVEPAALEQTRLILECMR